MKDIIEYNYNIIINEIDEAEETSSFKYEEKTYLFVPLYRSEKELNEIIECTKELKNKSIESIDLIFNKNNNVITKHEDKNYCLLRLIDDYANEVDIIDISDYNKKTIISNEYKKKYHNLWGELWSKKIDYFEYQISEMGSNKEIILETASYFIGLAENAIAIVNKMNNKFNYGQEDHICLSHRRIGYPNYALNYYNPLSYIFDLNIRDIAEYIKSCFFAKEDAYLELSTFLKLNRLTEYSYNMLFARLLYPSYYFDIYEKIMINNSDSDELIPIIKKASDYELFLKSIHKLISSYIKIETIDWIINL